jgi:hypothetical protein
VDGGAESERVGGRGREAAQVLEGGGRGSQCSSKIVLDTRVLAACHIMHGWGNVGFEVESNDSRLVDPEVQSVRAHVRPVCLMQPLFASTSRGRLPRRRWYVTSCMGRESLSWDGSGTSRLAGLESQPLDQG